MLRSTSHTSVYNRLVTVAVAFGSLVCFSLFLENTHACSYIPDIWLFNFCYWKHHWTAWLVPIFQPAFRRSTWICYNYDARHSHRQWSLQWGRSGGHLVHHVGSYQPWQKTKHTDRCSSCPTRRGSTRRSSEHRVGHRPLFNPVCHEAN